MRAATRRELLRSGGPAAGALAGGLLLAGSAAASDPFSGDSGATGSERATEAGEESPRRLLSHALMVEGLAQFAFVYGEHHFSLTRHGRSILRELAAHERAHARALEHALQRFGGPDETAAPPPPRDVDAADHLLDVLGIDGSLAELRDSKHALELLLRIEYAQEGAYYRAVEGLSDPAMALMAAEVLAVEAQHVVLLRELHQPGYLEGAAPDSFVVGPR